ncbi:uncharacterized protein CXQ87_000301 [Candidozyma duobushaemuli]|uniref:Uncharacterized protein n=2 Tax=Candidozyma TaxID=3303203 RepID=A0ABX8HZG1_9ASCO|nr:uncharacterized protein CXQ87_000301 [[Candida] duobushaemulonis]PVH17416.1 hypothetical protein CXQ87_000301 [[Candida] duobushaemulonis]QWU86057.1 hypothetical protein CA3LBN_000275 [[Candida] haemuloni]
MDPSSFKHTVTVYSVLVLASSVVGSVAYTISIVLLKKPHKAKMDEESVFASQEHTEMSPAPVPPSPNSVKFEPWKPLMRKLPTTPPSPFQDNEHVESTAEAEAIEDSVTYTTESGTETPNINMILSSTSNIRSYIYSSQELMDLGTLIETQAIEVPIHKDENGRNKSKVRLSQLLRFTHQIPRRHFSDIDTLERAIDDILVGAESCPVDKTISLFRLVTIGSTEQTYDNAYFFTRPFHQAVAWCSDLSLFSHEPESLQMSIAEMLICWCWNQWCCAHGTHTKSSELLRVLAQAASMASTETYHSVGHVEVMAVLCQVYSGLGYFAPNVQKPMMLKAATVMKACSSTAPCHVHRDLVPIYAQAVCATSRQSSLVALYECLSVLVSPHRQCCLEYRDLAPPTSDLLALLRHGLWTRQPPEVREKAQSLADRLGEQFEQMEEWCNRDESSTESGENIVAPGAWSMFR